MILQTLRASYNKINHIPSDLVLNLAVPVIRIDNVYIGVMANKELRKLYNEHGDSLFFENIRDFLGVQRYTDRIGRTSPNNEILKTLQKEPGKLLARNNGLVFGADKIGFTKDQNQLELTNGSLINGCQTTMCIVDQGNETGYVLIKAVQTDDPWDITKSANYQTAIPDIDLELARFLRPQLVKRHAARIGVSVVSKQKSAFQILDEIYSRKIAYDETRLFYIGLFSRSPNNIFASNYTELIRELIVRLYEDSISEESVFEMLFELQDACETGLKNSKEVFNDPGYSEMFKRLYNDDSLTYRCYIGILALCGAVNLNIVDRNTNMQEELKRTRDFLGKAANVLRSEREQFLKYYNSAVKIWMQELLGKEEDTEIIRDMYLKSKMSNFTNMYRKLCMDMAVRNKESKRA